MGSFSRFSMELAANWDWNLLLAPFASTILFGSLANAVGAYREICEKKGKPARKVKCSYFIHIGDGPGEDEAALERMVDYISMAGLRKTMSQGGKGQLPAVARVLQADRREAERSAQGGLRRQLDAVRLAPADHRQPEDGPGRSASTR